MHATFKEHSEFPLQSSTMMTLQHIIFLLVWGHVHLCKIPYVSNNASKGIKYPLPSFQLS